MRLVLVLMVVAASLVACGSDASEGCDYRGVHYAVGQMFPAGDGCNTCSCGTDGVQCTAIGCDPDAGALSCAPAGGCTEGPGCGAVCCGAGEACVDGVCQCGQNPGCADGDRCEAAGPIGGDACGQVCCGASGPCPQ